MPRVEGLAHDLRRHIFKAENVTLNSQGVSSQNEQRNATWIMGEALVFSLKQVSTQDWGPCVPSRPRALTKGQSQRVVGPLVGPKEGSQQIDRLRHRRVEASPIGGIALLRRRLRKASPG